MYIENINGPADVKKLNIAQMTVLGLISSPLPISASAV